MNENKEKTVGEAVDDLINTVDSSIGININKTINRMMSGTEDISKSMKQMCEEVDQWLTNVNKHNTSQDVNVTDMLQSMHDTFKLRALDQTEQDLITSVEIYLDSLDG